MQSLTQQEEMTKIRQLSNVYSFIYLRDFEQRDNQFFRGILIYSWYFIQMTGLFILCSNNIIEQKELDSINTGGNSSTILFSLWMKVAIYSRFNPILKYFSHGFAVPAFYLTILIVLDLLFLYFFSYLTKKSTKLHANNYKSNHNKITYVSIYIDLFRWFYLSLKTEIIFARFLCTYPESGSALSSSDSNQNLCSYLPSFQNLSSSEGTTLTILCFLNIVTLLFSFIIVFIINHSAEFTPSNPLKSKYSEIKIFEYLLIIISQYLAFLSNNSYVYLSINIKILYYLFEYFSFFPLYRADLSGYYLKILSIFIYSSILLTIREFTNVIKGSYHIEILFIGSSFIYGLVTALYEQIRIHILTLKLSDEPVSYPNIVCQHFYEILKLFNQTKEENSSAKLILHGILTTHQSTCSDQYCPCQYNQEQMEREFAVEIEVADNIEIQARKKRSYEKGDLQSQIQKIEKKCEDNSIGVYFTELMNKEEQFSKWIYEFINYHFRYLIFKSKKERNYNIEDISMKFWFFLINDRHNIINGLYTIKSQLEEFTSKSYFLQVIDLSVTRLIENSIKQKDRSLKYSFRKKDMEEAIQFEIFEQFVLSEVIKDRFKKDLILLLDQKVNLMQSMIEGFEELDTMQNQMISLIGSSTKLENLIKSELRYSQTNLHYLKMLSILRIRIQNDPIYATKIEKKVEEIHAKSLAQDMNLIHSITVLNGNVISIIASFKKERGKILKYSERTPQFFGYKKTAFDSSVKSILQLMPNIISINHDQIIERLIVEGTPKIMRNYRVAIAKDKDGYLFPIKIYVNYYYQINDDFIFSALILKLTTQSSYLLLNNTYQIEGISKIFLDFLLQIDENVTKELMDKIPIQLFLPDLPDIIKSSHLTKQKMEGVKLPMIIPDRCSKYFMGFKSFLKKMQGRDLTDLKLIDKFMSQSKKYFKEDVFIFEWNMNIVQDTFKLLNGFEFTIFQIEVIQNGLKTTTYKSVNEQDSFIPNDGKKQTTLGFSQNPMAKTTHKSPFEFDSTMFTQQYSQDQIKKKFHFKNGYSTNDSGDMMSDQKSILQSAKSRSNKSPQNNKIISTLQERNISQKPIIQSNYEFKGYDQNLSQQDLQNPTGEDVFKKQTSFQKNNLIYLQSFTLDNTEQQLNPNETKRTDLLMQLTEDEANKLRRSYDEIDFANAHGTEKQLPNQDFPVRIEVINNQQMCLDSNRQNQFQENIPGQQKNNESQAVAPQQINFSSCLSGQDSVEQNKYVILQELGKQITFEDKSTALTSQKSKQNASMGSPKQVLNFQGLKGDKEDDQKKKQQQQRMSVIQEHLNDSDADINLTSQNKLDNKLNETQQNLITQPYASENICSEANLSLVGRNSPILQAENRIYYDQNDTLNITHQFTNQIETEQGEERRQDQQIQFSTQKVEIEQDDDNEDDANKRIIYNKNKSIASNFFNSQQILTRNSSYDKDSNPLQVNLQVLKESTKFSRYKDDPQQQELSDGPTNDQLDNQQQSFQNESTLKEEVKLKPMEGELRACSVASSQNSQISTTIQRIYYSASSKNMPFFMNLFFQVIGFQLLFFGSICAIVCIIFNKNYYSLKDLTLELNFSSQILVPYSQNILILNAFSMENENFIDFSSEYLALSSEIEKSSLGLMEQDIFNLMNKHVSYNFQSDYLSTKIKVNLQSDGQYAIQDIYFFESIKTVFENFYYILQIPSSAIKLGLDQIYTLKMNYFPIEDIIQNQVTKGVHSQIQTIHLDIEELNKNVIIISCCLLFFCFILLIYPFWRYSLYVKGVLLSVSRMTEKEAEQEIIFCRFIQSLLKSSDEKYLVIKYTSFELNQIQNEELGISTHFNSQLKGRQNKNHQKKNYMLSQRINQPKIRLYHFATYFTGLFIFSIAIFATAYSIIYKFNDSLIPALKTYQNYLYALQKYTSFVYSTDQIFTQRIIKINKSASGVLPDSFISNLNTHRENDLQDFSSFFQSEFLILTEKSIFSDSLNNYIDEIQKNDLCLQTSIFSSNQIQICKTAMSSVMQQGLKVVISKISDDVGMKQIDSWSDQIVLDHVKLKEYENQLQVIQLTFLVLLQVQQKMLDDIKTLIDSYTYQIILIYSLGGVLYGIAFFIVCFSVYQNIYRRFFLIKKTVHLMPYKRLQDDQTTMNLIKNALEG